MPDTRQTTIRRREGNISIVRETDAGSEGCKCTQCGKQRITLNEPQKLFVYFSVMTLPPVSRRIASGQVTEQHEGAFCSNECHDLHEIEEAHNSRHVPRLCMSPEKMAARIANFCLPNGEPRKVRCYDNGGESADRYTVVFTGRYREKTGGVFWYVGMSALPFHPQGVGMHGESEHQPIDRPTYGHLGKKIKFHDLPPDCQRLVTRDYCYLWDLDVSKVLPMVESYLPTETNPAL